MSIPAAHSYLVLYPFLTVGRYRIPLGDYIEFQLEVILRKVFSKWFYEGRKESKRRRRDAQLCRLMLRQLSERETSLSTRELE